MKRSFASLLASLSLFGLTTFAQAPAAAPEQAAAPAAEKTSPSPSWKFLGNHKKAAIFTGTSESGTEKVNIIFERGEFDTTYIQVPGEANLMLLEGANKKGSKNSKVMLTFDDGAPVEQKLAVIKYNDGTLGLIPYKVKAQEALGDALYQCKKFSIEYYPEGKPPVTAVFNMTDLVELTKANKIKPPHKHRFDFRDALTVAGILSAL